MTDDNVAATQKTGPRLLAARADEVFVGGFFVVAAGLKAIDVAGFAELIRAYQVFSDTDLLWITAVATIVFESILGVALVMGIRLRGLIPLATALVLVGFSILVAYAAIVHGLKDCGCMGPLIHMGPWETIGKNLVLLAILGASWWLARGSDAVKPLTTRRLAYGAVAFLLVFCPWVWGATRTTTAVKPDERNTAADNQRPYAKWKFEFEGKHYDLGAGEYLVALLSATCEHCKSAVKPINDLYMSPGSPEVIGLVRGSEDELETFKATTEPYFPTVLVDKWEFMKLIGKEPPRFVRIQDGRILKTLDELDPTLAQLTEFVTIPSAPPS